MPPDQYAQAAQEALAKLSPEERAEFLKMLQERAAARGVKLPGNVAADPKDLGKVLTDLHEKPGQLGDIGDCYPPRWPTPDDLLLQFGSYSAGRLLASWAGAPREKSADHPGDRQRAQAHKGSGH